GPRDNPVISSLRDDQPGLPCPASTASLTGLDAPPNGARYHARAATSSESVLDDIGEPWFEWTVGT
ncbi:hypothetical protein GQ607_011100, partial [Colletotrichum asianum]